MSKTLYDEAIADAKRLREVAELNAKNAIVEAVTPRIREFIDSQLVGDTTKAVSAEKFLVDALNEGAADDSSEDEVVLDESALKSLVSLFTPKQTAQAKDSFQEAFDQLSDTEKKKLLNLISEEKTDADLEENKAPDAFTANILLYEIQINESAVLTVRYSFENGKLFEIGADADFEKQEDGIALISAFKQYYTSKCYCN
jgi:hypothetical protein